MEQYLSEHAADYLSASSDTFFNMVKLMIILYADDMVVMSDSASGLQKALHALDNYCDKWKLQVNVSKTKVVIFNSRVIPKNTVFYIGNQTLEIVKEFKYLGVLFCIGGGFQKAQKSLYEQAGHAMFALLRNCRSLNLPVDMMLELYCYMLVSHGATKIVK